MTLVEVLLAGGLMVVVLVAVLGVAESFGSRARDNSELTAAQEAARHAVNRITVELRSAGPGDDGTALLRAGPSDLVFASDNLPGAVGQWRAARYCWDGADLHRQVAASVQLPAAACPDPAWGAAERVAGDVDGPVFAYASAAGAPPTVAINLGSRHAGPLQSAVTLRNRALPSDAVACTTTAADTALLSLDLGVGQAVAIPLTLADLVGLRSLLFGTAPPPPSWECP